MLHRRGMRVRPSPLQCQGTHSRTQLRSRRPYSLTLHLLSQQVGSRSEFCFRSRQVRRGFLPEYFLLLVLRGWEETPCPAYRSEAIRTKGRLLFIFPSVIQKLSAPRSRLHCPVRRCQMTAEWSGNLMAIISRRRCRCYCRH